MSATEGWVYLVIASALYGWAVMVPLGDRFKHGALVSWLCWVGFAFGLSVATS